MSNVSAGTTRCRFLREGRFGCRIGGVVWPVADVKESDGVEEIGDVSEF